MWVASGWNYYWFIGIALFNPSDPTLQLYISSIPTSHIENSVTGLYRASGVCPWKHDYNWIEVGMVVVVVAMVQQRDVDDKDAML